MALKALRLIAVFGAELEINNEAPPPKDGFACDVAKRDRDSSILPPGLVEIETMQQHAQPLAIMLRRTHSSGAARFCVVAWSAGLGADNQRRTK
jgi:hypothetical protein